MVMSKWNRLLWSHLAWMRALQGVLLLIPLQVVVLFTAVATSEETATSPHECSIYLAPSSLQGHTGFGMYTTRDMVEGESFLSAPDVPSIPVVDHRYGPRLNVPPPFNKESGDEKKRNETLAFRQKEWEEKQRRRNLFENVFDNYWWGSGVPEHVRYESEGMVFDFQMTFGSLPNHHCLLDNIGHHYPDTLERPSYDDSMTLRYESPGSGAFSYHGGRIFSSETALPAGSELFLNYDQCTKDDVHQSWAEHIPMPVDYQHAATILIEYLASWYQARTGENDDLVPPPLWQDEERQQLIIDIDPMVASLLPKTGIQWQRVVQGLSFDQLLESRSLSSNAIDAESTKDDNSDNDKEVMPATAEEEEVVMRLARFVGSSPRSVDWIREHGQCLEHLTSAKSEIPHAGLGAFAQHHMKAGEIVVPVPLLQIVDKDAMTMYDYDGRAWSQQLLLNYCFGHAESSLLLCPTTNAGLINHCSSRTKGCATGGPNAEVRWAVDFDPDTKDWLQKTVDDVANTTSRGLSLEVVALRDIAPGDEVFIDYQVEFESAWAEHVQRWEESSTAREDRKAWVSAEAVNELEEIPEYLFVKDWRSDTLGEHPNLFTACQYKVTEYDTMLEYVIPEEAENDDDRHSWRTWSIDEILTAFATRGRRKIFRDNYATHADGSYWPCSVLWKEDNDDARKNGENTASYTVRIHSKFSDSPPWHVNEFPRLLRQYPRSSIHVFVWTYDSDQLRGYHHDTSSQDVFRHAIGLPEGMWPGQWKNLLPTSNSTVPEELLEEDLIGAPDL